MAEPEFLKTLEVNLEEPQCFKYQDNMLSSASIQSQPDYTNVIKSTDFGMEQIITFLHGNSNIHCPPPLLGVSHTDFKNYSNAPSYQLYNSGYNEYTQNRKFHNERNGANRTFGPQEVKYVEQDQEESSSSQNQTGLVRMPFIKNEKPQDHLNSYMQFQESQDCETMPSRRIQAQADEGLLQPRSASHPNSHYYVQRQKCRPFQQKVVRYFPKNGQSENQGEREEGEESEQPSYSEEESDQQFLLTVPQPKTHRKLRNRKYKKSNAQKSHYYAKDELTKKIMRDIREQLYKSFISIIPAAKLNNRAYQITTLRTWLQDTQGIKNFDVFDEQDLVTVFCHLAKALRTGLTDLEQILAGSKFKTIQFLRTDTGRYLFYQRFRKLWRHKVQSENILKRDDLRTEFTKYFKSIQTEVEAKFVHSKPTRGKPPIWKD